MRHLRRCMELKKRLRRNTEMSNANIDELNGQAVLDLIMGRLGRKDSAVEHWKGSFRTDR